MIHLIRKYFDRKWNKPNMYISLRILDDIWQYTIIIHGGNIKEYRIRFNHSYSHLVYSIILSIILDEDISTIYYDTWNDYQLIKFLKDFRFIKLKGCDIRKIRDLENEIEQDDIIDIKLINNN